MSVAFSTLGAPRHRRCDMPLIVLKLPCAGQTSMPLQALAPTLKISHRVSPDNLRTTLLAPMASPPPPPPVCTIQLRFPGGCYLLDSLSATVQ